MKNLHKTGNGVECSDQLRNNARHQDHPKLLSEWIFDCTDNYATLIRESTTDRIYVYDVDYRCDAWDEPKNYNTETIWFKIHLQTPSKPEEEITKLPSPLSPILKKSKTNPTNRATATTINVAKTFCLENDVTTEGKTKQWPAPTSPTTN